MTHLTYAVWRLASFGVVKIVKLVMSPNARTTSFNSYIEQTCIFTYTTNFYITSLLNYIKIRKLVPLQIHGLECC